MEQIKPINRGTSSFVFREMVHPQGYQLIAAREDDANVPAGTLLIAPKPWGADHTEAELFGAGPTHRSASTTATEGLYLRFAAAEPTAENFLAFANTYGLLGVGVQTLILESKLVVPLEVLLIDARAEMLSSWVDEHADLVRAVRAFETGVAATDWGTTFVDEVNYKLRDNVAVGLVVEPGEQGPRLVYGPKSILGLMWFQLAQAMTHSELKRCASCGELFERSLGRRIGGARRSDAEFCGRSSTCRVRAIRPLKNPRLRSPL